MTEYGHLVGIMSRLLIQQKAIRQRESQATRALFRAVKECDGGRAHALLDLSLAWHDLDRLAEECIAGLKEGVSTYLVDAWFLRDLVCQLTPGPDEEISYITGPEFQGLRVLSRIRRIQLTEQSVVYARGAARSCSDALIGMLEQGNRLHAMAHSHPGCGPGATRESGIDINYLGGIQRSGADVIGLIVTRDSNIRFYTVERPFQVLMTGGGVKEVDKHVYHLAQV